MNVTVYERNSFNTQKMISILIPTYNYNVFPLVANLQKQCEKANVVFEILVLDDASTDKKTLAENSKIDSLENCSFEVLVKNIGRSAIRNLLAEKAHFNRLLFLDADVLPLTESFILNYLPHLNTASKVICGGITYQTVEPSEKQMLRYVYGVNREEKPASKRKIESHNIVSANILILRNCFLEINTMLENLYGDDLVLSQNIKKKKIDVLHIDNPVIHFGLEENKIFIKKALQAIETTVVLEKRGLMDNNMRPIQKSYLKLRLLHLHTIFNIIVSKFKTQMEANFNSTAPNLFWFDIYRLNYYIKLKKNHNA